MVESRKGNFVMVAQSPLGKWLLLSTGWMMLIGVSVGNGVQAQVIPDQTLPAGEASIVSGNSNIQIDGGATRGNNLFHSFESFSIPTGGSAFFNNAATIQNIFSRITGGEISNIDGLIRANGIANMFVLNPNGILFGPNARLDIGGSFVASTASSINFTDGFQFSTTNPQAPPLLTISVPMGLQVGPTPGQIVVQGNGYDVSVPSPLLPLVRGSESAGLQVSPGRTLALIGGDVELAGGTLEAEQGRVELGSLRDGQVSLSSISSNFSFSYLGVQRFGDIRLLGEALADASGGGSIQVQGNQVSVSDGALVLIQNQASQQGGSIRVNAALVELTGTNPNIDFLGSLRSETTDDGRAADIAISTEQLVLQDGAAILNLAYGPGRSGDINLSATDEMQVIGFSPYNIFQNSLIATNALSSGAAGNLNVTTGRLTVLSGGGISSGTINTGNGGNVTVNATESVELIGAGPIINSNIEGYTQDGPGAAGTVIVNTTRLVARDGGSVSSITYGTGNSGSLIINATESVDVSGVVPLAYTLFRSQVSASAQFIGDPRLPEFPSGTSGDVTINTEHLNVTDGALVGVSHQGTGNAGILRVIANLIALNRGGAITASTTSGEGGNIDLQVRDLLLIRNNGEITSTAQGTGNGGNITIDTASLVAVPNEDSDINADSSNARGGNVTINADGLFGIQLSPQDTEESNITATGANSALNGTVQLNTERTELTSELAQLPADLVDVSGLIAQGCRDTQGSSFVVTGRGGLPPTPQQALSNDPLWRDWRPTAVVNHQPTATVDEPIPSDDFPTSSGSTPSSTLVEATGWAIAPNGNVVLTAEAPNVIISPPWTQPVNCSQL